MGPEDLFRVYDRTEQTAAYKVKAECISAWDKRVDKVADALYNFLEKNKANTKEQEDSCKTNIDKVKDDYSNKDEPFQEYILLLHPLNYSNMLFCNNS